MLNKTRENDKKWLALLVTLHLFCLMVSGCTNNKKSDIDTNKPNTVDNEDVVGDKEVGVFKLTKTSLVYENGSSTLITSVYNTSNETQYIKSFNIVIKDDSDNVMITLLGYIGEEIPSGDTRQITSSSDLDLSKAASVEYTINK